MAGNRVFGIDLGTTYSCIARVDDAGKPEIILNSEGDATTPSVVYFETSDNIVVGKTAKEELKLSPDKVVSKIKRSMGEEIRLEGFADTPLTPQEVSSYILRKVVKDAEEQTGDTVKHVVITCPAYFGVAHREATKQAGTLAGLDVRYVIPEPTAAAYYYAASGDLKDQTILVYDLGGGTFDVTVIDVKDNAIDVVCVKGDDHLGGDNWDQALAQWLAEQFSREHGVDPDDLLVDDEEMRQELLALAEGAKKSLSSKLSQTVPVRFGAKRSRIELTRDTFDEITSELLNRTCSLTEEVVATARDEHNKGRLDQILLVGGSTYMAQVRERLIGLFPSLAADKIQLVEPHLAVAKGAALYAHKCFVDGEVEKKIAEQTGADVADVAVDATPEHVRMRAEQSVARAHGMDARQVRRMTQQVIRNVTSKSFGVVVVDPDQVDAATGKMREFIENLIILDSKVPTKATTTLGTVVEGQRGVNVRCMENTERERTVELDTSTQIGNAIVNFARALPQGSPVEVEFSLSADGLLSVHATDPTTGGQADTQIKTGAILSTEEIAEKKELAMLVSVS